MAAAFWGVDRQPRTGLIFFIETTHKKEAGSTVECWTATFMQHSVIIIGIIHTIQVITTKWLLKQYENITDTLQKLILMISSTAQCTTFIITFIFFYLCHSRYNLSTWFLHEYCKNRIFHMPFTSQILWPWRRREYSKSHAILVYYLLQLASKNAILSDLACETRQQQQILSA